MLHGARNTPGRAPRLTRLSPFLAFQTAWPTPRGVARRGPLRTARSQTGCACAGNNPGRRPVKRPMSDPPGRQVRVEGTFVPRRPLSRRVARSGRTSRSRQPVVRGAGRSRGMELLEMFHTVALRGAARLLARRGYDNAQASELARAMHMSVGAMYRRYGSKLGLALAVREYTEKTLCYQAEVSFMLSHGKPGVDFAQAFLDFWWELAWWALAQPDFFGFTFLHWHAHEYGPHSPPAPGPRVAGALIPQQSSGGTTRALVREVLEKGEREGALLRGCVQLGEGLVWGTLVELARKAQQGAQVGRAEVLASARALWRALGRSEDSGPRGNGTPPPSTDEPSPGMPGSLAAASAPTLLSAALADSVPEGEVLQGLLQAPVADSAPEGEVLQGLPQTPVADSCPESRPEGEAPQVLHEAPVVDLRPASEAPQTVLMVPIAADPFPSFEASTAPRRISLSGTGRGASGAGRPRTRFAVRRSTCDGIDTRRPLLRTSSSAHLPTHPIERAECPDRARRNLRRSLLRVPRRAEGSARGPPCWRCCYRRALKHGPWTVEPAASCRCLSRRHLRNVPRGTCHSRPARGPTRASSRNRGPPP